jgi:hypothetical protein
LPRECNLQEYYCQKAWNIICTNYHIPLCSDHNTGKNISINVIWLNQVLAFISSWNVSFLMENDMRYLQLSRTGMECAIIVINGYCGEGYMWHVSAVASSLSTQG